MDARSRQLTAGEEIVLEHMLMGKGFMRIARDTGLPYTRVRSRASRIYDKLGASNRIEAVRFAINMGTLDRFMFWGS